VKSRVVVCWEVRVIVPVCMCGLGTLALTEAVGEVTGSRKQLGQKNM